MKFFAIFGLLMIAAIQASRATETSTASSNSTLSNESVSGKIEMKTCRYPDKPESFRVTSETCDWQCSKKFPGKNGACIEDVCQCPLRNPDDPDPYLTYEDIN